MRFYAAEDSNYSSRLPLQQPWHQHVMMMAAVAAFVSVAVVLVHWMRSKVWPMRRMKASTVVLVYANSSHSSKEQRVRERENGHRDNIA